MSLSLVRRVLPALRERERVLVRLAAAGGRLSPRALSASEREALAALEEEGLVALEEGRAVLRLAAREEASPTAQLASRPEAAPVRRLILLAGRKLPAVAQPLAREAPEVLLRAAEAALPYGPRGGAALVLWLPKVAEWAETFGKEAAARALGEAARKAREPFPYAERILARTARAVGGLEVADAERF